MSLDMNTGDVGRRMGIPITAEHLTALGFKPVGKDKRAFLWADSDYPEMCRRMGEAIKARATAERVAKPEAAKKPKKSTTPPPADDDDI